MKIRLTEEETVNQKVEKTAGESGNQTNSRRDGEQLGGDNQESLEIRLTDAETESQYGGDNQDSLKIRLTEEETENQ